MKADMQAGFTLVEMLVALTILALISVMSWRGLDAVLHADEQLNAQATQTQALFNALSQMARDLEQHVQAMPAPQDSSGPVAVLPASIRWQAQGQGPAMLLIERRADQGVGAQQIQWRLEQDRLQRAAGPGAQAYPLPEPGPLLDVLEPVSAWNLRVWIPARGWQSWPWPQEAGLAATGIELSIQLADEEHPYRKVVMLP
ncbi:MAG TPA: prepilin-type N-terminal cleavage/methylation domain-containing protein [Alcaligenes sp.]|nr:prepilin-type N-terminal cleavage/methylation domain-containing protein [Alcaligenes sp.]HRL26395.1 prepilin-type N-terminal cleavage/methylation domain-containing protein [Alcaligenes sp.]